MIYWLYLLVASLFEIGWIFSLKFVSVPDLKKITLTSLTHMQADSLMILLPFIGYVLFGVGNIYFFSMAMKHIPASTAFAVWTVMALAGTRLIEIFFLKQSGSWSDYFFMSLLVIAIIGLKKN